MTNDNIILDRTLQDELQQEDGNEDGLLRLSTFVDDHPKTSGAFIGYLLLGIFLSIVLYCLMREVVWRAGGLWKTNYCLCFCKPFANWRLRRQQRRELLLADERLARELQQQINESVRETAIVQRRQERRKKYEVFLAPYTMVVKEENLVLYQAPSKDEEDGDDEGKMQNDESSTTTTEETTTLISNKKNENGEEEYEVYSASVGNMDDFDAELGVDAPTSTLLDFNEGHGSFLCLPASRSQPARQAETCCAICLTDYEVGDRVVYSCKRDCPHVFHEDCILTWLSKGKKRCPICRHWFVPSTSIDDKKVITHDAEDEARSLLRGDTLPMSEGSSSGTDQSSDSEDDPLSGV